MKQKIWHGRSHLGSRRAMPLTLSAHFNFRTKQCPKVSISNIRDIAFYGCSEIIPTRNFTVMTVYTNNFWLMYSGFSFFLKTKGKQITSRWTFSKVPILNAGPSEKFSFVGNPKEDHEKPEFKPQIRGGILDLPKKFSKTREASI